MSVSRNAGCRLDDSDSTTNNSVKKGGFTYIGSAYDRNQRIHNNSIDLAGQFSTFDKSLDPADNGFRKGLPVSGRG